MHFLMVGQIVAHCPSFWNYFRFKMNMICESWGCIFASLHSRPRLGKMSTFSANLLVPRSRIFVGWGNDKIVWSSEAKNQQLRMADFDSWSSCSDFLAGRFVFPTSLHHWFTAVQIHLRALEWAKLNMNNEARKLRGERSSYLDILDIRR